MIRAIVGLLKGLLVGGGVGYLLYRAGLGADNPAVAYAATAIVGALVGVICGRAPWRSDTAWTPVVKAIVGGLVGAGLCALGLRFLPTATLFTLPQFSVATRDAGFLATAVGVLYGMFVEVDDGAAAASEGKGPPRQAVRPPLKKR